MSKKSIGFIGLGAMGRPMATNLVKAGYSLNVYDIKPDPVKELVGLVAKQATSCADAAQGADTVITMLPADPQVREAVLGIGGVLETARAGATRQRKLAARLFTAPVGQGSYLSALIA